MKTIYQEGEYDCGTACLAMLAGVSYEAAAQQLFGDQKPTSISSGPLVAAMRKHGLRARKGGRISKKTPLKALKTDALLKGYLDDTDSGKEYAHWLVWDHRQQVVRDPYGYRYACRITSYISVER